MSKFDVLCAGIQMVEEGDIALPYEQWNVWQRRSTAYRFTFTYQDRVVSTDFWCGDGCSYPSKVDVLGCLIGDAEAGNLSWKEFCADGGYDTDSRRALRVYRACRQIRRQLREFLGEEYTQFVSAWAEYAR